MHSLTTFAVTLLATSTLALSTAVADEVTAEPTDPGRVTAIGKGVKEIDLGGIFVLSVDKVGEESNTKLSTLMGAGFQYFINNNVSLGATALFSYDKAGADTQSTGFGGVLFGSFHVRLGLGAFFRPTLGLGGLFGNREIGSGGTVAKLTQTAFLTRIGLPFAYFPSRRVVLQAGPEINVSVGSFKADGSDEGTSFTTVAGGFAVGVGYVF
ncbi:MAG: hypothetical protein H0T89_28890 [Deltaproteobacteria bacterium]|nr:hypothetical protein [Deltaproteobacteria bacterium]MDQ3299093.1 hypothetical protein [Myxococcota bacterium]